jgi:hypothetical protein
MTAKQTWTWLTLVYALAACLWTSVTIADDSRCAHCGCDCNCSKVCRLVCEEKKVDVICWSCRCEDFCLPGPGKCVAKHCVDVCGEGADGDGDDDAAVKPKRLVWHEWLPSGAKIYRRKRLMKRIEKVDVPTYKWVVEDICDKCNASCLGSEIPPDAELPPPPSVNLPLRFRRRAN